MKAADLVAWLKPRLQDGSPRNRQMQDLLLEAVLNGRIPAGQKLPSSRCLASQLGVARNTVIDAYENLIAQGCLLTRPGSGTYAAAIESEAMADGPNMALPPLEPPRLSRRGSALLQGQVGAAPRQWGAFMPGVPDVTEFPASIWLRLHNRQWRQRRPERLSYAPAGGLPALREALAAHVHATRSVRCEPEQIIITNGSHQGVDLAARLLCDPGEAVWLEDPCYWGLRASLLSHGLRLEAMPVDGEGMLWPPGAAAPRLMVVTPSHQYPLGMVMSLARRQQLIEQCHAGGGWILEDDYDSEFRYASRPLPSLQGLEGGTRVLYLGSFSKTLFPGLRLGYLVVPKPLAAAFARASSELFREGQLLQQATLADFIQEGHLAAHVRRMRTLYGQRRERLLAAIQHEFGEHLPVLGSKAGLHLVLGLPETVDDGALTDAAAAIGIAVRPLSRYYADPARAPRGLLLGYACVPDDEIAPAFSRLATVIRAVLAA